MRGSVRGGGAAGDGIADPLDTGAREPLRVGFVLLDGFPLMAYATAREPLRAANLLAGRSLFAVRDVPVAGARAVASSGAVLPAGGQVGESVDYDLVLVVAGPLPLPREPRLERWLAQLARHGVRLGGVSGGPIVLARAGLLEGYRATLHWEHAPVLAEERPDLLIERGLFVIDRDRLTCAGGTAPFDMMHALIAERHGATFARAVNDWFAQPDARGGDGPQRIGAPARMRHRAVRAALTAMEAHLSDPLDMTALAARAGVGPRQLARLFARDLGERPTDTYRAMRLERARTLLRRTDMSVGDVALATGFASFAHFSAAFRGATGQAPREWRRAREDD